ncbi:Sperm-associated antigen 6 [Eumeta japonica]|uniref:Sperm-associated antigen 6 n=1 Tax=Eumeta variegata TaxID=151549 RepID=A0A4C1U240_EUMVA|nr:Sperm-associated antigen 6 [Eumeta japonica]
MISELSIRASNVKCLVNAGVLELLQPLVCDESATVRQCAVLAAARLAEHDEEVARHFIAKGLVASVLERLNKYNVFYKRFVLYLVRAVAKHNEELSGSIVRLGAIESIILCLEDFDTQRTSVWKTLRRCSRWDLWWTTPILYPAIENNPDTCSIYGWLQKHRNAEMPTDTRRMVTPKRTVTNFTTESDQQYGRCSNTELVPPRCLTQHWSTAWTDRQNAPLTPPWTPGDRNTFPHSWRRGGCDLLWLRDDHAHGTEVISSYPNSIVFSTETVPMGTGFCIPTPVCGAVVAAYRTVQNLVKENACWALGYIGKHSEWVAGAVIDAGALPLLLLAFQEPELSLKLIAAGALVDLAQQKPEAVVEAGAIFHLVRSLDNQDAKLKRNVLCALSAIASARPELAEAAVAGGALPPALLHAAHDAPTVRRAAACLIRDIVKHSIDLAQVVVNTGGCGPLVEAAAEATSGPRLPAVMALGFIAGQSDQLAMAVIESKAVPALVVLLQSSDAEEAEACAAAWALGHVAKHSPHHSEAIAVANALPRLLELYTSPNSSNELRCRACCALRQCLQCCLHRPALEPLLHAAPPPILKYILAQYAKILPNDAQARRLFVTTGALKKIQEIEAEPGSSLKEYINIINSCFPEEIVRYYTPGFSESLLDRVDAYVPQVPELFTDRVPSDCQTDSVVQET